MTRDEQRYEDQQADLRSRRPVPGSNRPPAQERSNRRRGGPCRSAIRRLGTSVGFAMVFFCRAACAVLCVALVLTGCSGSTGQPTSSQSGGQPASANATPGQVERPRASTATVCDHTAPGPSGAPPGAVMVDPTVDADLDGQDEGEPARHHVLARARHAHARHGRVRAGRAEGRRRLHRRARRGHRRPRHATGTRSSGTRRTSRSSYLTIRGLRRRRGTRAWSTTTPATAG